MTFAYPSQRFQDWLSQQWVIWRGQRINPEKTAWLMGPFGNVDIIGDDFITKLASDENLEIERNVQSGGLIPSINELELSVRDQKRLSSDIIDFYEKTALYDLDLWVEWKSCFRFFGGMIQKLYSNRLKQLNLPLNPLEVSRGISSELVRLRDRKSGKVKYTLWYRVLKSTGQVVYSGIYSTTKLPSGKACIKAVFPLPRGNATVIMEPTIGPKGELQLSSSGEKYGDPGFYFLLNDSKGGHWAQYIRSFREKLEVFKDDLGQLRAEHSLTLWKKQVLEMHYKMNLKKE